MKKKTGLAALLAAYALLLLALTAAEAPYPEASIKGLGDALWYSLVTITTVGYGDLYPVSPAGKVIALFFLLLSAGALALAISLVSSALTGSLLPRLRLISGREKPWFIFSQVNEAAIALARDAARTYPGSLILFCDGGDAPLPDDLAALRLPDTPADLLPMRSGEKTFFFIGGDMMRNSRDAMALRSAAPDHTQIYCLGEKTSGLTGISFFDPFSCCARQYWQSQPIARSENDILIVGSGHHAYALLSQALLVNCRVPFSAARYHLFGDWSAYRLHHPQLCREFAQSASPVQDALCFHDGPWNGDPALLESAGRIIFCADDESENVQNACLLDRFYPHSGNVFVRCMNPAVPGTRFGQPEALFTCETVMLHALDHMAMALHSAYRSQYDAPDWTALDRFIQSSNRAAADHMLTKVRLLLPQENIRILTPEVCRRAYRAYADGDTALIESCRENEHARWMRFHLLYNWQYAPKRDNAMRRHPSLIPFTQLSEEEKAKDDYAWIQLDQLPGHHAAKES